MNSSGFSIAQYRDTRTTELSSSAITLTGGSVSDVLYTAVMDAEAERMELLGVVGFLTAATGTITTAGEFEVEVVPADGSSAYTIQNDPYSDASLNGPFRGKLASSTAQGTYFALNLNKYQPHRNRAAEYPEIKAGDTVRLKKAVVGSGGTQTLKVQFVYRLLGSVVDTSFYGQEHAGTQFVGTGNSYPYTSAEGYPNYGKKADEA